MPETKRSLLRLIEIDRLLHNSPRGVRVCDIKSRLEKGVTDRTIQSDLKILMSPKEEDGFDAPIEIEHEGRERFYKYKDPHFSIFTPPINDEEKRILNDMFHMLERFENIPEKLWLENLKIDSIDGVGFDENEQCVEFEETDAVTYNSEDLHNLYTMIVQKKVVSIEYEPYTREKYTEIVSPYYLKQFNRRWFLIAKTKKYNTLSVYSLDRIRKIKMLPNEPFEPKDEDLSFRDYFSDIVGVTITNKPVEKVVLAIEKEEYPYIKSKAIHESQKQNSNYKSDAYPSEKYQFVTLRVIENRELISRILSYGDKVIVVEPESLRKKIAGIVLNQKRLYED